MHVNKPTLMARFSDWLAAAVSLQWFRLLNCKLACMAFKMGTVPPNVSCTVYIVWLACSHYTLGLHHGNELTS